MSFPILPPEASSILSIDSAYVRLYITSIIGECVTFKVTIASLGVTKYYTFNCDNGIGGIGGSGGSGSGTKEKIAGRTIQSGDSSVTGGYYLKVDLTAKKDSLFAHQDEELGVTIEVTTPGGRVECVSGFDANDTRPQLMLKGSFRKANHLADYTLRFDYDDPGLAATARAKVDDSAHSANVLDSASLFDGARRTAVRHLAGPDGRLLRSERTIVEDDGTSRVDTTRHAYIGLPRRTKTTDPLGDTVVTRYDALGRAVEIVNADGTHSTIAYAYDDSASTLGITDQDFYGFVMAKTVTNENGTKTTQFTDAFDQLRREIADSGSTGSASTHLNLTTRYEYDIQGRLTRAINPKGDTTKYAYDDLGRVQYKYQPDIGTVSYTYDNAGNIRFSQTQEQASGGRVGFTQYDDLKRVTVIGEAVLGGTAFNEDTMLAATGGGGTFPPSGRLTGSLDPNRLHTGNATTLLTWNRTLWSNPQVAVPAFSPLFGLRYCTLPANADLGETSAPVAPFIWRPVSYWFSNPPIASCDTNSFEHIGQHPEFVRIVVAYDTIPDPQGSVWQTFPTQGQWDQLAPHGTVRNLKGHEAAVAYRERGCEPFHFTVMSYDERGRVEALMRWNENLGFDAVYYTYNSMNQVTCVRTVDPWRQHATWYGYDRAGRIDSVWSDLTGTGTGLLTFTGIKYIDPPSRPDTADIVYRYTKTGQLATMQYPPVNVLVTYAYNHRKWLDSLVSTQNSTPLFREILSYDPSGQITKQIWRHGTSTRQEQQYSYDSVQRLTGWTQGPAGGSPTSTTGYSYDAVGNRLDVTSGSTTVEQYTITTGKNQLSSHRTIPSAGFPIRSDYGYNRNGSTVERIQYEDHSSFLTWQQTENYGYSFRELMKRYKVATPGPFSSVITKDWRYRYSAGGEREQKRMYPSQWGDTDVVYPWVYYLLGGNKEQLAVYHGQQIVNMYCPGDTGRRVYFYPSEYITYGANGNANLLTHPTGSKVFTVADHLGSSRVVVDNTGSVIAAQNFTPFGEALAISGNAPRKGFIDKEQDRENNLDNTGVRGYDPKRGRFMSLDPLWENYRGIAPYHYVNNNPLKLVDPSGMKGDSAIGDAEPEGEVEANREEVEKEAAEREAEEALEEVTTPWEYKAEKDDSPTLREQYEMTQGNMERQSSTNRTELEKSLAGKAPKIVSPGIRELNGTYVNDLGRPERWTAFYDSFGRMIGRTDYNAGNRAMGIPEVHWSAYEYSKIYPLGRMIVNHAEGEYPGPAGVMEYQRSQNSGK